MHQIEHTLRLAIPGSEDRDRAVRAAFVAKGTTLNAWCIANGFRRATVDKAIKGQRRSRNAQALIQRLLREALGIES